MSVKFIFLVVMLAITMLSVAGVSHDPDNGGEHHYPNYHPTYAPRRTISPTVSPTEPTTLPTVWNRPKEQKPIWQNPKNPKNHQPKWKAPKKPKHKRNAGPKNQ